MSNNLSLRVSLFLSITISILSVIFLLSGLKDSSKAMPHEISTSDYPIRLAPDQLMLEGEVATLSNCIHPDVCGWFDDTQVGTIILGVDPASRDPNDWDGGSATAEINLPNSYNPTLIVLKLSWPYFGGKGLHSPDQDRMATITLDGRLLWSKRTTHLSTFGDYYAAEHAPILTTIVLTQSVTHTLKISVPEKTAWDLSQIELIAYPYPATMKGIGYSPFRDCQFPNPQGMSQPSTQEMQEDLYRLFHTSNAIRTYSATGVNGQIPAMANEIGLPVYAGAWINADLKKEDEIKVDAADIDALLDLANTTDLEGVIVGNEYYLRHRSNQAIDYLLQYIIQVKNGIPEDVLITTAEITNLMFIWEGFDDFQPEINPKYRPILDELDFVMVHIYPFWDGLPIDGAASFTVKRYKAMQALLEQEYPGQNKWIVIGETGWPSHGKPNGEAVPSLENQHRYLIEFLSLAEEEDVEFMYFDAFDELWKIEEPGRVGQAWGYGYSDRAAKYYYYGVLLPWEEILFHKVYLPMVRKQSASNSSHLSFDFMVADKLLPDQIRASEIISPVYTEWPMGPGYFVPSGWMGDLENISLFECDRSDPHSGEMAIRASFSPTGTLGWGGIYWQYPENNWGNLKDGLDLSQMNKLTFWAKGVKGGEKINFFVGGIGAENDPYPDSLHPAVSTGFIELENGWKQYTINLAGKDLSHVIGGFGWAADKCANPETATFYLDDMIFEYEPGLWPPSPPTNTFPIYTDAAANDNHYAPSGWMGDLGDIHLNECWTEDVHSGSTSIRVEYTAEREGPYECDYSPCGWAGVYWQHPAENWGNRPGGYDLTGARALTFWAKGENGGEKISFKIGGIGCGTAMYPDSLCPVRIFDPAPTILTSNWQPYTVPLSTDLNLSSLVGGFLWAASKADNPNGAVFYLDDIQYHFNIDMPLSSPFSTPPIPIGAGSGRTFDFEFGDGDNDGWLDIALGNHGQNQVCWNNRDGTFDCVGAFEGVTTFDVEWGDMNNDGYLDIVVANSQEQPNLVCLNDGNRNFICSVFSTCADPMKPHLFDLCHVALGDVDCDDDLDIVVGTRYKLNIWAPDVIYYNEGDGTFTTTSMACRLHPTLELDFGDMDADGDLDLAVVGHYSEHMCINGNSCTGIFTETHWLSSPRLDKNTWSVALGDSERDGDLDVAVGRGSYLNAVYLNAGDGDYPEGFPLDTPWEKTWDVAWGDVDDDGDLDLATGNSYRPTVVYFNEPLIATLGFTLTRPIFLGAEAYRSLSVAFGNVDGDCDLDLAVSRDGGQNVIYLNNLNGCENFLPVIMKNIYQP